VSKGSILFLFWEVNLLSIKLSPERILLEPFPKDCHTFFWLDAPLMFIIEAMQTSCNEKAILHADGQPSFLAHRERSNVCCLQAILRASDAAFVCVCTSHSYPEGCV